MGKLFLTFVLFVAGMNMVAGQGNVKVEYDEDTNIVSITNNGDNNIIFFPRKDKIDSYPSIDTKYFPHNKGTFDACGVTGSGVMPPTILSRGKRANIKNVTNYKEGALFYYYIEEEPYKLGDRQEVLITPKSSGDVQETSPPPPPPPTSGKPEKQDPEPDKKKDEPKKPPVVNANITTREGKQDYFTDEDISIRFTFTGKFKKESLTWTKTKTKPQGITIDVNPQDTTIKITGKISQAGQYPYSITIYSENDGLPKTIEKKLNVKRNPSAQQSKKDPPKSENTTTQPEKQPTHTTSIELPKETPVVEEIKNDLPEPPNEIVAENEQNPSEKASSAQRFVIIITVLLFAIGVIFYVRTFLRNKRIKHQAQEKKNSGTSGLLIEEDAVKPVSYKVDLTDVRENADKTYYEIDMMSIHKDSAIRNVYFSRKAILDIYKFFSDFLRYGNKTNETGCFLVGRWDYAPDIEQQQYSKYLQKRISQWEYAPHTEQQQYDITIDAIVEPSNDAIYGEYTLNFGAKIGITLNYAIENLCEETGNEYVHTAWMHSHPGLGLFLSSQDLNVQSQLAHSHHPGRMLAIVIDSNSPNLQTALFAPRQDGIMNNDNDLKQILSLETLYQWAKSLPNSEKSPPSEPNYFSMNILPQTGKVNKAHFSGAAIIGMDMAITDNTGVRGYFYGTCQENEITINDFKETNETETKPIGCLLVIPRFSYQEVLQEYLPHINTFEITVAYAIDDGYVYLLTKDEQNNYPEYKDKIIVVSLMKMKEWTRRKR